MFAGEHEIPAFAHEGKPLWIFLDDLAAVGSLTIYISSSVRLRPSTNRRPIGAPGRQWLC